MRKAFALALLATAAAAKKPITADTLWDWRTVSDPQISPDGKTVVFGLA